MTEAAHAKYAPSGADIWVPCPGSVAMQAAQPPEEESEESAAGTAAHWLLAQILLKLPVPADAIAPNGVPIDNEMREGVADLVRDVTDTLTTCKGGDYFQVESKVAAPTMVHPDFWGTPDVFFVQWSTRTVHIWDFKYGHKFVDPFRHLQLVGYAACVIESESITDWHDWTFTFTIAQPRCYVSDVLGGPLREWFTDGRTIAPFIDQLAEACRAADAPDAPCVPGEHCTYCRAIWDCSANQRHAMAYAELSLGQSSLRMDAAAIGLEARVLRRAAGRLTARLKALEVRALALLDDGQSVPHHAVSFSQPRTVWAKDRQEEAASIISMFADGVARLGVALPTPKQVIALGVDASVISPYTTKAAPAKKLVEVDDAQAEKVFRRRD